MAQTIVSASPELGNAPAWALCLPTNVPFPPKLCGMLLFAEQAGLADVVSWLPHGRAFRIHDNGRFMTLVAGRFLAAKKLRSVHRQLLVWGFQRIDKGQDRDAWFHKDFVRGQPKLMRNMIRTKIKGKVQPTSAMPDFLPRLDGAFEPSQKPAAQPARASSLSQELSGSLHRGAEACCNLSRSASCPDRIAEAGEAIEPLPFRGNQDTGPFDDDGSTLVVDRMIRDLFSQPFADGVHRGAEARCGRTRRASCPGAIAEPASRTIEPLPFRGNQDKVAFDGGEVSPFVDRMVREPSDEFSLFIDWTIYDPDAQSGE